MNGYLVKGHMKIVPSVMEEYVDSVKSGSLIKKSDIFINKVFRTHCEEAEIEFFIKKENEAESVDFYREALANILYDVTTLSTKFGYTLEELMKIKLHK